MINVKLNVGTKRVAENERRKTPHVGIIRF